MGMYYSILVVTPFGCNVKTAIAELPKVPSEGDEFIFTSCHVSIDGFDCDEYSFLGKVKRLILKSAGSCEDHDAAVLVDVPVPLSSAEGLGIVADIAAL